MTGLVEFSTKEVERLLDMIERSLSREELTDLYLKAGKKVGVAAEMFVVDEYPSAPGRPLPQVYSRVTKDGRVYRSKFQSERQQRWFFFALEHDIIKLPYRRTGRLGASVTHRVFFEGSNLLVEIGSNLAYAPFVIGDPEAETSQRQSMYHSETGWEPLSKVVREHDEFLIGVFIGALTEGFASGV